MAVVVRVVQVLVVLGAGLVGFSFVMASGSPDTGPVEKVALLVAAALCLWGGLAAARLASRLHARRPLS